MTPNPGYLVKVIAEPNTLGYSTLDTNIINTVASLAMNSISMELVRGLPFNGRAVYQSLVGVGVCAREIEAVASKELEQQYGVTGNTHVWLETGGEWYGINDKLGHSGAEVIITDAPIHVPDLDILFYIDGAEVFSNVRKNLQDNIATIAKVIPLPTKAELEEMFPFNRWATYTDVNGETYTGRVFHWVPEEGVVGVRQAERPGYEWKIPFEDLKLI